MSCPPRSMRTSRIDRNPGRPRTAETDEPADARSRTCVPPKMTSNPPSCRVMNSGRFDETMLSSADIRSWSGPYAVSEKNACAAAVFPPFAPPGVGSQHAWHMPGS